MKKLTKYLMCILFVALPVLSSALAADHEKDEDRLKNSGIVLKEILDVRDDIPQDLLDKADCVVVFPSVLKAAFIVGGSYGRGAMSCRQGQGFRGRWGSDVFRAERVSHHLASSARERRAGHGFPAQVLHPQIAADFSRVLLLCYSRARGAFAGIALEGSTIRPDGGANEQIYGQRIPAKQIVRSGRVAIPAAAQRLVSTLDTRTPDHKS